MSKKTKQENLFISTQQDAQQAQMLMPTQHQLQFKVEDQFKCPIYMAHKPEWVDSLNKASDPIIESPSTPIVAPSDPSPITKLFHQTLSFPSLNEDKLP